MGNVEAFDRHCWVDASGIVYLPIIEKYAWSVLKALSETITAGMSPFNHLSWSHLPGWLWWNADVSHAPGPAKSRRSISTSLSCLPSSQEVEPKVAIWALSLFHEYSLQESASDLFLKLLDIVFDACNQGDLYTKAPLWQCLSKTGYGQQPPVTASDAWMTIISLFVGTVIWTFLASLVTSLLISMNAASSEYMVKMMEINTYMDHRHLPQVRLTLGKFRFECTVEVSKHGLNSLKSGLCRPPWSPWHCLNKDITFPRELIDLVKVKAH